MAFVEIYNARRLVESRSFNGNFYMRSDGHVLFWAFGLEGWQTDEKTMSYGPNPQRLNELIRMTPTSGYFLQAVPPNWTLKINEIECPKGGYMAFDICWRSVELVYRSYQFKFSFTAKDSIEDCEDTTLPLPDIYRDDIPDVDKSFPL
jgi:hypothetical protein